MLISCDISIGKSLASILRSCFLLLEVSGFLPAKQHQEKSHCYLCCYKFESAFNQKGLHECELLFLQSKARVNWYLLNDL